MFVRPIRSACLLTVLLSTAGLCGETDVRLSNASKKGDRAAVRFTRNPVSLIDALEVLDRDDTEIHAVTRATAPLWIEVPRRVYGTDAPRLSERIVALRELAGLEPEAPQEQPQ